jgi:hypothetical protein
VKRFSLPLVFLIAAALAACGGGGASGGSGVVPTQAPSITPATASPTPPAATPQFVGYYLGWESGGPSVIPSGMTAVNVFPGFVDDGSADGSPGCTSTATGHTVSMGDISQGFTTAAAVSALHSRGIKVLLTLGGASPVCSFLFDGNTAGFVASLQALFTSMGFDGVDFDDETEYDVPTRVAHLVSMVSAVHQSMPNTLITLAVFDTPGNVGDGQVLSATDPNTGKPIGNDVNWINVMTYLGNDLATTECDVADYVLGVPGYSSPFPAAKTMVGTDIGGDSGIAIPTDATLQALGTMARSGFTTGSCPNNRNPNATVSPLGGVMLWYVNPPAGGSVGATAAQIQAIETGLSI